MAFGTVDLAQGFADVVAKKPNNPKVPINKTKNLSDEIFQHSYLSGYQSGHRIGSM